VIVALQATSIGASPIARQISDIGGADCPPHSPEPVRTFNWCYRVKPPARRAPVVAVVGDSTALALNTGMTQLAGRRGWAYIQGGKNGCSLLPLEFLNDVHNKAAVDFAERCGAATSRLLDDIEAKGHPDLWLVADRWSVLPMRESDGHVLQPGDPRRQRIIRTEWIKRFRQLTAHDAKVVVIITPPPSPPIECALQTSPPAQCASGGYTTADPATAAAREAVQQAAAHVDGVVAVSVDDLACPDNGRCPAVVDGVLTRYDTIHWTATFSSRVLNATFARARKAGIGLPSRAG
jgi:hypothetical protein